ncbi:MAG: DUF4136 domain-containing protein [Pseudomonadota bacterium]
MAKLFHFLLLNALLAGMAGCAPLLRVAEDIDRAAPFGGYARFAILAGHPLDLTGDSAACLAENGLSSRALADALRQALSARGLEEAAPGVRPDVYAAFTCGARRGLSLYSDYVALGGKTWLWSADPRRPRYGADTLALDIFDGRSGNAVWHGYVALNLAQFDAAGREKRAAQAMTRLGRAFPPDPKIYRPQRRGVIFVY